jgi:hypothetical protein
MVCVKIIVKPTMIASEHSPPLADLNSGFSLYLKSSVVLKRSHAVTACLLFLNTFVIINYLLLERVGYDGHFLQLQVNASEKGGGEWIRREKGKEGNGFLILSFNAGKFIC